MAVWQTYGVGLHECFHKLQSEQKIIACFGLDLWRFVVKLHGGSVPEHGNFSSSFDFVCSPGFQNYQAGPQSAPCRSETVAVISCRCFFAATV